MWAELPRDAIEAGHASTTIHIGATGFLGIQVQDSSATSGGSSQGSTNGAVVDGTLPGSPGACKDAWDGILVHQLDYRYRPCNFVEIMPRLDEHLRRGAGKATA